MRNEITSGERITFVAIEASTYGRMVDDIALSRNSTKSWAWILTFFSNTGLITSTLGADCTFWPATRRSTNISWKARA